jgi:hemoglobin-like flavoprotein
MVDPCELAGQTRVPFTRPSASEDIMTPEQVGLVQESFKKVLPIAPQAADLFYGRLFEIAPQVRPMFPADLKEQKRKLMTMLAAAVTNLHQIGKIVPAVQDLGRRHAGYGVTAEHYKPVGEALIWTLEQGLGDSFTPAVESAWVEAYTTLAGVMTAAAKPAKKSFFARVFG